MQTYGAPPRVPPLLTADLQGRALRVAARNACAQGPHMRAQNDFKLLPGGGNAMMNRRRILCAAVGGAAILARIPNARAATYDLLLKGGRVIDPSLGLDGIRDVAIAAGRIVAVDANI